MNAYKKDIFEGQWTLMSIDGLSCNVCPIIYFEKGNGKITNPLQEEYLFNYDLKKDRVTFHFTNKTNYFENDSVFLFKIIEDNNVKVMELNSINSKSKYILSKSV